MEKIAFTVSQFGIPLSEDKYTWDEKTRTFISTEHYLIIDFLRKIILTLRLEIDAL